MIAGILIFLVGGGLYLASRFGIPFGRLPGDINIEGKNGSFHFPLMTSIILSILLTVILNIVLRLWKK
jgi:hypothetical protein